jgi:hypothetical protein
MPDCQDQDRKTLIHKLAIDATLEASQSLLEHAIHIQDSDAIEVSQQLIEKALIAKNPWNTGLEFINGGWTKTVNSVLSRGTPLKVTQGQCQIIDCPSCFYENICSREQTHKVIQRSRDLIASINKTDKTLEESKTFKAKFTDEQALKDSVTKNQRQFYND